MPPRLLWLVTSCRFKFLHLPERIPRLPPLHLLAPVRPV
ncbi:hypothetical protein GPEL0_01r3993 [Geoanaerobacter pelophilus]|uniref:Uncharacterized protein n=1 Tax=Geoanaerobacter pelophilus TaxID=60036 RepID=A0ABQ0MLF7_9BACT|nr:hypothetical protein GPEL0_01r3993 [Geoanaerobacter pelophilus]